MVAEGGGGQEVLLLITVYYNVILNPALDIRTVNYSIQFRLVTDDILGGWK